MHLSTRQRQIVQGLANGLTSKEISDRLGISQRAVRFHLARMRRRNLAATREHLVALCVAAGIVEVEAKEPV